MQDDHIQLSGGEFGHDGIANPKIPKSRKPADNGRSCPTTLTGNQNRSDTSNTQLGSHRIDAELQRCGQALTVGPSSQQKRKHGDESGQDREGGRDLDPSAIRPQSSLGPGAQIRDYSQDQHWEQAGEQSAKVSQTQPQLPNLGPLVADRRFNIRRVSAGRCRALGLLAASNLAQVIQLRGRHLDQYQEADGRYEACEENQSLRPTLFLQIVSPRKPARTQQHQRQQHAPTTLDE
jgi:hypothetical protein